MLPFPIINKYGNVVVESSIKKMTASSQTIAILYTNGNLYMRGTNQYNSFGVTGGSTTDWTLCKSDVDDVWCGYYHTIVKLKNGEYWCAGFYRSLGTNSGTTTWAKYQKLHDLLTANPTLTILQIQTGQQGTHVLLSNNKLYSIGYNATYCLLPASAAGNGASVQTFTLSYTGAKKVCTNINAGMIITTANKLMVMGSSDNYKLGSGNGTLTAWTAATLPSAYPYVIDIHEGYRDTLVYAAPDSTGANARILMSGYNGYNTLGLNPNTASSTLQTYTASNVATTVLSFGTGWMGLTYQGFYVDGTTLYTSGVNGANIGSKTDKISGYTAVPFTDTHTGTIDSFGILGLSNSNACTFVLSNNNIYAIGVASWLGTDTYTLTRQNKPE